MIAIAAERVGKTYRQYQAARPHTLQEAVIGGFQHMGRGAYFWSLREVSFTVPRGRALGVIGRNGAGKSTLLRILAGISQPDEGQIRVHGRVGGLLELTAGFHPDLTGRENVYIGGVIRGLTRAEVDARFDAILDFAELRHAVDAPIRSYSSGMQMRLAFAVAIHCEPDILLMDEVLAVGDAAFQKKCLDRIEGLRSAGCTIVMVSHDASLVQDMCDQALWLREGSVAAFGDAKPVVAEYMKSLSQATVSRTPAPRDALVTSQGVVLHMGTNRFGSQEAAIVDVRVATGDGSICELATGDALSVEIDYLVTTPVEAPIFCITVVDDGGRERLSTSTEQAGIVIAGNRGRGRLSASLKSLRLDPGTYFVDVGIYEAHWKFAYDYHSRAYPLIVRHGARAAREAPMGGTPKCAWVHDTPAPDDAAS